MYHDIYHDETQFKLYLRAQKYTIPGKTAVVKACKKSVVDIQNAKIALAPSDIGLYYPLLQEAFPKASFIFIDEHLRPLIHIQNIYGVKSNQLICKDVKQLHECNVLVDIVCCFLGTHLFSDPSAAIKGLSSIIAPHGDCFILTMSPEQENSHFMGNLTRSKKSFEDINSLVFRLVESGFELLKMTSLEHSDTILMEEIPKVFCNQANSLLYKLSEYKINRFHKDLESAAVDGKVTCRFKWTLLHARKEDTV